MADQNDNANPVVPVTPVVAGADAQATKDTVLAAPSHGDWANMAKTMRELHATVATLVSGQVKVEPTKVEPAKVVAKPDELAGTVASLQAELATIRRDSTLTAAFLKHGISDVATQDFVKVAVASLKPEEIGAFIERSASLFKGVAAKPGAIAPGTSNTGAAGGDNRQLPTNVHDLSPEAWKALPLEEQQRLYRASVPGVNPVRQHRDNLKKR